MANTKISELTAAAALTGTEVLPIVQSGATVKATAQAIANLGWGKVGTVALLTGTASLDQANFAFGFTNGPVGIGSSMVNASALLDISSTTKGLLIPRMTEAERDAITAATGLMIFQTDGTSGFYYWDGGSWEPVGVPATTLYSGDGTIVADRTVALAGKIVLFTDVTGGDFLELNPFTFRSFLAASDGTSLSRLLLNGDNGNATDFLLQADDGATQVEIFGSVDDDEMTYTAATHTINGDVNITGTTHSVIGDVGVGATPDASSALDVSSTTKGLLLPRMTEAERDAIAAPATSLLIFQTDGTPGFYWYDGANWVTL